MERRAFLTRLGGAAPTRLPVSAAVTVIEERDPARFRAAFVAAVGGGGVVALANPDWGLAERVQFERLLAQSPPSFSWGNGLAADPHRRQHGRRQTRAPRPRQHRGGGAGLCGVFWRTGDQRRGGCCHFITSAV